jgi:hypothetical protein
MTVISSQYFPFPPGQQVFGPVVKTVASDGSAGTTVAFPFTQSLGQLTATIIGAVEPNRELSIQLEGLNAALPDFTGVKIWVLGGEPGETVSVQLQAQGI